ncbi:MAG: VacJ family lipoprotein [Alphaproteobacteria bacterium]|nr:VacJ family lipoprotein [Alphaproteobacteria bacterium]
MHKSKRIVLGLTIALTLSACATRPSDPDAALIYDQNNDPLEPMNRTVYGFNQVADKFVLTPLIKGYRAITPQFVRTGLDNFFTNLKQPIYFANALLQADFKSAGTIAGRFSVNSLIGFFGLVDSASQMEIPVIKRDFGETLAVWGIKDSGPYLVLPLLGPSTLRETIGMGVDAIANPVSWTLYGEPTLAYGQMAGNAFITRDNAQELLDTIHKSSTDSYATMRSMYQQNRQKEVNTLRGETDVSPDYDFDFPDDEE